MLTGNLSTRPFYNDRLVGVTMGVIAVAALALTAFNATQVRSLSQQRTEFNKLIDADVARTRDLDAMAAALGSTVDVSGMKLLSNDVREANDLIDQRTFSWTAFLSVIEKTLPYDARLIEVAPKPEKSVMHVEIIVVCKTPEDTYDFVEKLEKSGAFRDVNASARSANDDGTETVNVQAVYDTGPGAPPAPPPAKKPKGRA